MDKHQKIINVAKFYSARYGYDLIDTPLFEYTQVFKRTLGETSDVVGKEMYTFTDRGGEEVTLRPEGTAGVIRAVISNGLTQSMPLKLAYYGPMLRYERPQLGRRRQFHQFGVEFLGVMHPLVDVETIALGVDILQSLGVMDHIQLEINTLGDTESRQAYRQALIDYFTPIKDQLSLDSQQRLHRNPLRILDSKDDQDKKFVANAPQFQEFLTIESRHHFNEVCMGLDAQGIRYIHNSRLVRGLDYYNHTAFEFVTTSLGAQGTVLGGGRYNGLMSQMGGPETPGIGWALGIERLGLLLGNIQPDHFPVSMIPIGEGDIVTAAFNLVMMLRRRGILVDFLFSGNVGKRLKRANKVNAVAALLLGEDELAAQHITVKDLATGSQKNVALEQIGDYLKITYPQTYLSNM
jgi:histidyl-tRNA synthetase